MKINLQEIKRKTFSVKQYIESLKQPFRKKGEEIGKVVENPKEPTLEEELLKIILEKCR
jgi:hypothetical protein